MTVRTISTLFLLSALIWPGPAPAQTMPETMKVPESSAEISLGFVPRLISVEVFAPPFRPG